MSGFNLHTKNFDGFTERPWDESDFDADSIDCYWRSDFAKILAIHMMLSGPMFELWRAVRMDEPGTIEAAEKALDAKAMELYRLYGFV